MLNYYQILRLHPETDILGKSEAEIKKKIENNYKALMNRAPQMYPATSLREQMLKEIEAARAILSDQTQRKDYDEQLKSALEKKKRDQVSIVVTCVTEENIAELCAEDDKE